jgi:hypothetical protein
MMKQRTIALLLIILIGPLMWLACGGSGGGTSAGGGIGGSGVTTAGMVTATGSIFVNGVKYETDDARVTKEDHDFDGRVGVGMLVRVNGSIDAGGETGTARAVEVLVTLRGTIAAVEDGQLSVLGQNVQVDDEETVIDNDSDTPAFEDLVVGDPVEVSGFVRPGGGLHAARIEVLQHLQDAKVTGIIEEVSMGSFRIGGLTVHHNTGEFEKGDYVEAIGTAMDLTTLGAARVRKLNGAFANAQAVDLEGYLGENMTLISPLGSVSIEVNPLTEFIGGTADDLIAGERLSAQGRMHDGTLVATAVTFAEKIKVEATVAIADPGTGMIELLNLPDLIVKTNAGTRFLDRRSNSKPQFPAILGTLSNGEWLWIKGRVDSEGVFWATLIRIDPQTADPNAVILTAPVDQISDPYFEAASLTIQTDPFTTYENAAENEIDAQAFFDSLTSGTLVRVRGLSDEATPNTITAQRVNLEE